jgi:hypothetical protein
MEKERRSMSVARCIYGQSTERPCPRPATVERPGRLPDGVRICEVHAALETLGDEVWDLALALEKLDELEEYAKKWGNRPMLGLVERARAEFSERVEFLGEHVEAVSLAGR